MGNLDFLSQPPTGDPKKDDKAFVRALAIVWTDNYAVGPAEAFDMTEEEWIAAYDDRLRTNGGSPSRLSWPSGSCAARTRYFPFYEG